MRISVGKIPSGDVLIYEYGVRPDKECLEAINDQIAKSRRLYNELIATIRAIFQEMQDFILDHAGEDAKSIQFEIDALNLAFSGAKARNCEPEMKRIAQERRLKWRELSGLLGQSRKILHQEIKDKYFSRIGKKTGCITYDVNYRQAVNDGLGWATANAVLDAALGAYKKTIAQGKPPRFSVGSEKDQDALTLQFTDAGGISAEKLLGGKQNNLSIIPPVNGHGRRKYGEFKFRLGSAKMDAYATGTWQYHRPLPEDSSIGLARLVRRRIGKDDQYVLQLMVKLKNPMRDMSNGSHGARMPLVTVHFGWASDISGRRIAGIADCADPGSAQILRLPTSIENSLERAATIQGTRDSRRDAIVPFLKEMELPETAPENLREKLAILQRLPAQYISCNKLHWLCRQMQAINANPDWLEIWRREDRLLWQAHTHIARRARNTRRDFYRQTAIDLARKYGAIALEPLDLKAAAQKVDENSGEKTEFSKKARAGRVVAAIYELESALRWAAAKTGAALLEIVGQTASWCAICGSAVQEDQVDGRLLRCDGCNAELDRKENGAAIAWQFVNAQREDMVEQFWLETNALFTKKRLEQAEKSAKMAAGRENARNARTLNVGETM